MASHQFRTNETRGFTSRTNPSEQSLLHVSEASRNYVELNTTSAASSGRQSNAFGEGQPRIAATRPSALPRSTSSSSQARLSYIASTRPMPTFAGKSPPLQAISLTPATTSIPRIDTSRFVAVLSDEDHYTRTLSPMDAEDDTILGVALLEKPSTYPPAALPPRLIPELQALAASNNRYMNPASSSISSISSPSTQFTTSSSPWSASTTTTTPISWSSASPHFNQTSISKRSHTVPVPANVKSKLPKLPVLKERQTPLSASKFTQAETPERTERIGRKLKKTPVASPEPNPPPRSSSLKRIRSRSNSAATGRSVNPDSVVPNLPSTRPIIISNIPASSNDTRKDHVELLDESSMSHGHSRLQEALNSLPESNISTGTTQRRVEQYRTQQQVAVEEAPRSKQLLEPLPIAQSSHRRFPSLSRRYARRASNSEPEVEKQSARSRLAKFSKLALFGRSKVDDDGETKQQKLQARKGPATGTGHEGYGKFRRRGRKQSTSSSVGATDSETSIASVSRKPLERKQRRSSSTSQDQSDLDDFASSRLKPVVMLGGSQRGRDNPFPLPAQNLQFSNTSLTTVSSADSFPAVTRSMSSRRERFPPSFDEVRPTLASRRSQRFAESSESFPFPQPIETKGLATIPALDSRNTTHSSEFHTPASAMYRVDPAVLEKQRSKSRKLRWNIFRRKDSISETREQPIERPRTRPGISVNVEPAPTSRPIPYYAMMGHESEMTTTATIGQFLREAQESPERDDEMVSIGLSDDEVTENPYVHRESVLLPSAPVRQIQISGSTPSYIPQINLPHPDESAPEHEMDDFPEPPRRQPRLAQVGRIPKVIPTRQQSQPGMSVAQELQYPQPQLPRTIRPMPSREELPRLISTQSPFARPRAASPTNRSQIFLPEATYDHESFAQTNEQEFLRFVDIRNSDFTTSSESTGIISIMGPPLSQAQTDNHYQMEHLHHDDEVWNEYNDFMDDIMSPVQKSKSASKSRKTETTLRPDEPDSAVSQRKVRQHGLGLENSNVPTTASFRQFLEAPPPPPLLNVPPLQEMTFAEEIRLRRSRIAAALHTSYAPSSPWSMREFLDEYGRPISGKFSERLSASSAQSANITQAVTHPPHREQSRPRDYENAAHLEEIERVRNPTKHSDRSYASLMVSRWLSFGRVLFSPAHQEIETDPGKHVLVIDGLGSADWSIYCAVTYQPQNAYVHDLKEKRHGKPAKRMPQQSESAPPNHRRSEVSSFNDKFPFPPGFFCAIIIRFPPAMPDSKLKNIVAECRRVLAPGGYLELMVLDLDIVNMGVQTRRAIKDLKIKMSAADRSVSLKPIIDNIQTVLGSNGFPNVSRCVVGVPVVGKPAGSLDSSSESRSSGSSTQRQSSAGPRPYGDLGGQANFSLNDLVADHSENADAKIGKMVSRTARSWWQHCFEAGIITDSNKSKSVLANKEVLSECKARAANFKLLIAFTQKPAAQADQNRRTMSEPTVATLATVGLGMGRS